MNSSIKLGLMLMFLISALSLSAQNAAQGSKKKEKKIVTFTVERIIPASVDQVWKVVGEEFGAIANSHPKL